MDEHTFQLPEKYLSCIQLRDKILLYQQPQGEVFACVCGRVGELRHCPGFPFSLNYKALPPPAFWVVGTLAHPTPRSAWSGADENISAQFCDSLGLENINVPRRRSVATPNLWELVRWDLALKQASPEWYKDLISIMQMNV